MQWLFLIVLTAITGGVHSRVFSTTESWPGSTIHAPRAASLHHHAWSIEIKKPANIPLCCWECKNTSMSFSFLGDNVTITGRPHRIYCRPEKLFVLSQVWGGSCDLSCHLHAKGVTNEEVRVDMFRYCFVCLHFWGQTIIAHGKTSWAVWAQWHWSEEGQRGVSHLLQISFLPVFHSFSFSFICLLMCLKYAPSYA